MANLSSISTQLDRIEGALTLLSSGTELATYRANTQRMVIEMLAAMADNRKIVAIKTLRTITDLPLKEAKDFICNASK